ncbi:MAG: HAD-IA family hydrolase [Lachnospiraceae bacterium]|nr:HAD-IA family hydrolase [Lachnospiraceae bacterium]
MQKITTILIDMYGVILEESKGKFIPYTFNHFDKAEHERLKRQFKEEQLFTRAGLGEFTSDEFLSMLGYENPQYHMKDYIENSLTLDVDFIPFAEKYCQHYEFVLLSNDVSQWSSYITEFHQLDKYFLHKIVSGDVGCRKPEKKIFELALEKIGKCPEECLFIDNSVKNLEIAEELGILPILFNRDGEEYEGRIVNSFGELDKMLEEENENTNIIH